jgi:hypothetical protein
MTGSSLAERRLVWIERMERFSRSGLSVKKFCDAEGVSVPNFYRWRQKLAPSPDRTGRFVAVSIKTPASAAKIILPGGASIEVPAEMVTNRMSDLFAAVIEASKRNVD